MSNIALVDDDRNILLSLSMYLEAEGFLVDTYSNGRLALDAFSKQMPDLAVLDLKMPQMDGMELLQRLRQKSALPVILLSSKSDEVDEILGLRMGADGYLTKPFSQRVLLERIHALLRRQEARKLVSEKSESEIETSRMVRGHLAIDPQCYAAEWKGEQVALTAGELLLLQALARQPGVVMSRDQLLDVVCGAEVYLTDRTIDGHIKRIRSKMRDVDEDFTAIETVHRIGYRYKIG